MKDEDIEIEKIRYKKMHELLFKNIKKEEISSNPIEINNENFNENLQKYNNLIIDFWAEWCAPCKAIAPIIEELAKEYAGKIVFGKINVDENQEIAAKFFIMSIPTLIFFKNGKEVNRIIGLVPKEIINKEIEKIYGKL
ncbi:MAG: thioredoxin [Nitrososphaerota archaeon]